MRKILLHRGAALPTWRASILPALMWLILLAIFPARLHAQVTVNEPSITVPTHTAIFISSLSKVTTNVVEGLSGGNGDYIITSSVTSGVHINSDLGWISFDTPCTSIVTYTHKENPDESFSIEMTAKLSPARYVSDNIGNVYIGESKTLTIPDGYMPLSDFTLSKRKESTYPDADFDFEVNGNEITITGIAEGQENLAFRDKYSNYYCIINISKKPTADDIEVKEKSITVPAGTAIYLRSLIRNGIVEGVPGSDTDYTITTSVTSGVDNYSDYGWIRFTTPCTSTVTYTSKEFPDVSFSIEMTAQNSPADYVSRNIGTIYIGEPKTLTIPDGYMPLSDFTLSKSKMSGYPDADFDFEVNGNEITLTGIIEGQEYLYIDNKFGTIIVKVTIAPKPSADDIKVNVTDITYPINYSFYLNYLITNKVVEGISGSGSDYSVEASDPGMIRLSGNTIFFTSPGTTTLTFSNKDFPDISFSIDVTAKYNPAQYITTYLSSIGSAYVGESKTIVLPDTYIPFSNFDIEKRIISEGADFEYTIDGNALTVTGISDGTAQLRLTDKVLKSIYFGGSIKIKTREVAVEVNEEGEATAGSQLGVPVTVALPEDIDLTPTEDTQVVWEAEDNDIVEVDPVTGEITPLKLGKTIITVKRVPVSETAALVSRAAGEETLVTIEFWVTELELAEEMTLEAGSGEQLSYTINAGDDEYPEDKVEAQWTSSNPAVATVDKYGYVKALSEGSTVITLSTNLGTKQIIVNVEPDNTPAGTLSISPSDVALNVGSSLSLSAKGAADKKVIWRTSNAFVARIDENGVITGIASGTATITATIEGTSISASTTVTVFANTTGIEETETSEPVVTVNGMIISVSGIDAELPVEIYNVSGGKIASRKGCCSVTVAQSGIYIVRVGGVARKVAVKY